MNAHSSRNQNRISRVFGRYAFVDNARVTIDLPRDFDLETVGIRVTGNAAVTTLFTAVRNEAPLQVVKWITLKANGSDVLDSLPGHVAHRIGGLFRRGQLPPVLAPTAAAVAVYPIEATYLLDRVIADGMRPKDSAFPTRGLQTLQLELQMGACAELFTGAGVGTITSGMIEVFGVQLAEERGADGRYTLPFFVQRRNHSDYAFATSSANWQQRLTTGNVLRGLMFRASGAVTLNEPSDAVVNNVKVLIGNQVVVDLPWKTLRALNATNYEVTTIPTGYAVVDLMANGGAAVKMADALDLRKAPEINVQLDVTGGASVAVGISTLDFVPYDRGYWGLGSGG